MRNNQWRLIVFMLLCGVSIAPSLAQQSGSAESAETEQAGREADIEKPSAEDKQPQVKGDAEEKAKQKKPKAKPKSNEGAGKKVFRPSEEISEDSPVPFPVDI